MFLVLLEFLVAAGFLASLWLSFSLWQAVYAGRINAFLWSIRRFIPRFYFRGRLAREQSERSAGIADANAGSA